VKRDNLAFLLGGLAVGLLLGVGLYHAWRTQPQLAQVAEADGEIPRPRGTPAPTQAGPNTTGGAPMVAVVNELKRRLQADPRNVEVLLRLANLYHDAAMWEQAVGYYERAREIRPDDADLLTDLGVCYRNARRFEEALESFERAHRANPQHWQSLYNTVIVAVFDVRRAELALRALAAMEAIEPRPAELTADRVKELRRAVEAALTTSSEGES
jgi:tetratricopeptide (TPR) repeat protein